MQACEATAMDRQPAPKHRQVEADTMTPADLPPWEDQPMGEDTEGRSPIGGCEVVFLVLMLGIKELDSPAGGVFSSGLRGRGRGSAEG